MNEKSPRSDKDKPIITLYGLTGVGVIVPFPSGVIYLNQVGGNSTFQKAIEGVFIPIESTREPSLYEDLDRFFVEHLHSHCSDGIDVKTADFLDESFAIFGLPYLKVNRDRASECCEAWIHVISNKPASAGSPFNILEWKTGILTWPNSD